MGKEKKEFTIVDNKKKKTFSTGSMRDTQEGKGLWDSVPWYAIHRLAVHLEKGAKKYSKNNYKKGQPLSQYINSAFRHLAKLATHQNPEEDHISACIFNLCALMETEQNIKEGKLPKELDDLDETRELCPQKWGRN